MEFQSEAIVLNVRKHGETNAIVETFTKEQGRHSGLVRGGVGRRMRPVLQPGNVIDLEWRGRLEEHLGYFTLEIVEAHAASLMDDRLSLSAINAIAALLRETLPEKQAIPALYDVTMILLQRLNDPDIWPAIYVRWEAALLQALGYGLDLSRCAGTGVNDDLIYVSPRSGRAVSAAAGEPYKDKLFPLPPFLRGEAIVTPDGIGQGLAMTGYFLETRVQWERNRTLPDARRRMVERLQIDGWAAKSSAASASVYAG